MELPRALSASPRLAQIGAGAGGFVLAASAGAHETWAADGRFTFAGCDPVESSTALVPHHSEAEGETRPDRSEARFEGARGWGGFDAAPRWVGAIPYDALRDVEITAAADMRPRHALSEAPRWQRYDAVLRIDHGTGVASVEADDAAAAARLVAKLVALASGHSALAESPPLAPLVSDADAAHVARVEAALKAIERGEVYEVNVARTMRGVLAPRAHDAYALFAAMHARAAAPFDAYFDAGDLRFVSSSPELAVRVRAGQLATHPLKGTRLRGTCAESDAAAARELDADAKENAELVMAVDVHRNDLGRVAALGSVRVDPSPHMQHGARVHSRGWTVRARRAPGASLADIARAVLPCGSITGAPKRRAMELVRALEAERRGFYTGALGYLGRDGTMVLSVIIRTLVVARDGAFTYGVGGGIVSASDPARECEETWWKTAHLAARAAPAPRRTLPENKQNDMYGETR